MPKSISNPYPFKKIGFYPYPYPLSSQRIFLLFDRIGSGRKSTDTDTFSISTRRTHTYAYLPSDIYLCLSLEGHILIQISQRTYIGLILILVLRILYLYYRAYTCISDLIILLRSLFLYFISYTCITSTKVPVGTTEILLVQKYP